MNRLFRNLLARFACASLLAVMAQPAAAAEGTEWRLQTTVQVDGTGIYLHQLVAASSGPLPQVRLAPAPAFGQATNLSRAQVWAAAEKLVPGQLGSNLVGAAQVRVTRRARSLGEAEVKQMLSAALQQEHVKDRGELEIRFARPWTPVAVPDESLTLKVVDIPATGLAANLLVRFEVLAGEERAGTWQTAVQAKLWRDVLVARTGLRRGQTLQESDLILERRDVLAQRDLWNGLSPAEQTIELTENLQPGQPLLNRSVRLRPAVRRGRLVEAVVQEGMLSISLKVEVMEDGLLGETVKVRNPKTKREFHGRVQNEQTVLVAL